MCKKEAHERQQGRKQGWTNSTRGLDGVFGRRRLAWQCRSLAWRGGSGKIGKRQQHRQADVETRASACLLHGLHGTAVDHFSVSAIFAQSHPPSHAVCRPVTTVRFQVCSILPCPADAQPFRCVPYFQRNRAALPTLQLCKAC